MERIVIINEDQNDMGNCLRLQEYAVVGGGPAAICAIASIIKNNLASGHQITWIDPQFKVGNFGTTLSVGSSVPGNTSVENYQTVLKSIYKFVPECAPKTKFEIDTLDPAVCCSIKTAVQPLQHITDRLRNMVTSIEGRVMTIVTSEDNLNLSIKLVENGQHKNVLTKRVILATGAEAKKLVLPERHRNIKLIDPHVAFIRSELNEYLGQNPDVTKVAVIGSSHSAALASMHLLQSGVPVKQFMNKEYKFATPRVAEDGTKYLQYDNTGLKGDVASFTRQLLANIKANTGPFVDKYQILTGEDREQMNRLLDEYLGDCSHAVVAIGYETVNSLEINNIPITNLTHNNKTTQFNEINGLFGIGIAFPQVIKAISGEVEFSVGVGKFWKTVNSPGVVDVWRKNPAPKAG